MFTGEMAERAKAWQDEVMTVSKQITAAQAEYKEATSIRLKKKHTYEELQSRLAQLCERGPFGEDSDSPGLLDNEVDEDSTRTMNFPRRVYDMLDRAGVETVSRLESIIDGEDDEYVGGLDAIPGMDIDARDRIMAQFNDENDEDHVPDVIPYSAPIAKAVDGTPKNVVAETSKIRLKVDLDDFPAGSEMDAMLIPSGQAVVTTDDMTTEMLESNQFELVLT